ncbi:MAG: dephospho-CoA kinase [Thermomicrobiales bacterium]|nr:dephospho-CoA kinase [Thermomicrobiales bacterium]
MTQTAPGGPLVIGLTGPIAAGKSQVAQVLAELGADVIDSDAVYHSLITPPSPLLSQIAARFGAEVLDQDGALDRAALGRIVFSDPAALADLEAITHPAVVAEVRRRIAASPAEVVVNEAIKLIESGMAAEADVLWLVDADPDIRLKRLMARNSLDEATARTRLAASRPALPAGLSFDEVLDNSGSWRDTQAAVLRAWQRLPLGLQRGAMTERTTCERA